MSDNPNSELYFGKYKTKEEAEKGFSHLVEELNRFKDLANQSQTQLQMQQQVLSQFQQMQPPARQPEPQLVDDEGNLDVRGLLQAIDNRLSSVESKIPEATQNMVQQLLGPVIRSTEVRDQFFSREDLDPAFSPAEFDRALARNSALKKVYSKLLADPDSASAAYETVYQMWKAAKPSASPKSDERTKAKKEAGDVSPAGGQPIPLTPEAQLDMEQLRERAKIAQDMMHTDDQLAFARQWIKGSKLEKNLEDVPDWADDAWRNEGR